MAHSICGIDVGAHSIKIVVFEIGFRQTLFRGALEQAVADGPEPLLVRQVAALGQALGRTPSDATLYLALPGDQLSIRALDLPFSDPRKIDQVIGYELEGQIVHTLEEVVYDHLVVRTGAEGSNVLAVAAKRDDVGGWLEALTAGGVEPRALYAAPVIYHALEVDGEAQAEDPGRVPAILDLGHMRSNLYIGREGQGLFARTITRGGHHLTAVLAQAFDVERDRAEEAKRDEARLLAADAPRTPLEARLDEVLRGALAPLVRDVRQTLASFRAQTRLEIDTLYLTGGGARLAGLPAFLRTEFGVPVQFLAVPHAEQSAALASVGGEGQGEEVPAGEDVPADSVAIGSLPLRQVALESSPFALAMAVGLGASRGRKEIDLRRGPYVYRASFSVVRQKALHLGLLAASVLLAGGLDVFASLSNLGSERKGLDAQLKTATQELFGQPRADAKVVTQLLRKGLKEDLAPVPKATAFDLLDQISKRMPPADKIKLDVAELEIRAKKTFIKGTVDSATAVDEMAEKLKEIDCYEDVTKGAITEVSDGAKQFTLNVAARCP
jgi:general secretion pathway protein L